MIRGGHVDVAILGVLQVDQAGLIANWAVPGKILWVSAEQWTYLLERRKSLSPPLTHLKMEKVKLLKECTYPITSTRSIDMIITELAVFEVVEGQLKCIELMPDVTIEEVREKTEAALMKNYFMFNRRN